MGPDANIENGFVGLWTPLEWLTFEVVAWKERSGFRGRLTLFASFPEYAALLPGYGLRWHTCRGREKRQLLKTLKFRHSSEGWNPVLRIIKYLEGLGPSLRWDDEVFRSCQNVERQLTRRLGQKWPERSAEWRSTFSGASQNLKYSSFRRPEWGLHRKAGIQSFVYSNTWRDWVPAFAGMTNI